MKKIKKIWKTKIRVLLPNSVKRLLTKIGNRISPSDIYSTTSRDEFLLHMSKINKKQENSNAAQAWWRKQEDWNPYIIHKEYYNNMKNFINMFFVPHLSNDSVVCDLACACGDFSVLIADKVKQIDAFDLAESMINVAINTAKKKKINNIVFKQADALSIDLETNKYDAFMMLGLLTCIDDPYIIEIVKKVHDSMKDGAKLVLKDGLLINEVNTKYIYNSTNEYSAYYRTYDDYLSIFLNNGFSLLSHSLVESSHIYMFVFEKKRKHERIL